jgi:DNA-binding MarR family transcriptional regulator
MTIEEAPATDRAPAPTPRDVVDEIVATWSAELPEVAGLPLALAKRIGRLAALLDLATAPELERRDLTRAEYEVLAKLRAAGRPYRRKPHELAQSLLLSSGGTTNVLHRLAAADLVTREADPADRRSQFVKLTPKGIRTAEEVVLATNAAQADLLANLPEGAAAGLADHLRTALHHLDGPSRRH